MFRCTAELLPHSVVAPRVGPSVERGRIPLDGVVIGQVHRVRGPGEPPFGVQLARHDVHIVKPLPLVVAVARHRQQAVPAIANGKSPRRLVGDVAIDVGVDLVLGRRAPAIQSGGKLAPAVCPHVFDAAEVGRGAGLGPYAANGEDVVLVLEDDRAMARELELDVRRRRIAHRYRFVDDRKALPIAGVRVAAVYRVVDVEIFLVDAEHGQTEGNAFVVANRQSGKCRFARADNVEAGCGKVGDIPQRGYGMTPVRIVGQNRSAGRRACRRDRPVVAAQRRRRVRDRSPPLAPGLRSLPVRGPGLRLPARSPGCRKRRAQQEWRLCRGAPEGSNSSQRPNPRCTQFARDALRWRRCA